MEWLVRILQLVVIVGGIVCKEHRLVGLTVGEIPKKGVD